MKTYVLYHSNCMDGTMSAYVAWFSFLGKDVQVEYIPVQYNAPFPQIELNEETEIYILDFSYSREILEEVHSKVKKLVVLDHHVTAQKALEGLPYAKFDMEKSGATMAWEYFHPGTEVPDLVKYVEDRDLWKFRLPGTRDLFSALMARGALANDQKTGKSLFSGYLGARIKDDGFKDLINEGEAITRFRTSLLASLVKKDSPKVLFTMMDGLKVGVFNTTEFISEAGEGVYLNNDVDFSMSYFIKSDGGWVFSLRSAQDKSDVSKIASSFGGGGHAHAAGFHLSLEKGAALMAELVKNRLPQGT